MVGLFLERVKGLLGLLSSSSLTFRPSYGRLLRSRFVNEPSARVLIPLPTKKNRHYGRFVFGAGEGIARTNMSSSSLTYRPTYGRLLRLRFVNEPSTRVLTPLPTKKNRHYGRFVFLERVKGLLGLLSSSSLTFRPSYGRLLRLRFVNEPSARVLIPLPTKKPTFWSVCFWSG